MQVRKHLETNNIFLAKQHGFKQKHSTESAFSEFIRNLVEAFDKKHKAIVVFNDLSKAFESLQHNIFLSKLELYGIKGKILMWFSSYLQNRKQFVTIDGHNSDIHQVEYGVPQGGILCTLLFLIMINNLNKALKFMHVLLYADDTTIKGTGQNLRFMSVKINKDLEALSQWLIDNKLTLNVKETKYMIFIIKI